MRTVAQADQQPHALCSRVDQMKLTRRLRACQRPYAVELIQQQRKAVDLLAGTQLHMQRIAIVLAERQQAVAQRLRVKVLHQQISRAAGLRAVDKLPRRAGIIHAVAAGHEQIAACHKQRLEPVVLKPRRFLHGHAHEHTPGAHRVEHLAQIRRTLVLCNHRLRAVKVAHRQIHRVKRCEHRRRVRIKRRVLRCRAA